MAGMHEEEELGGSSDGYSLILKGKLGDGRPAAIKRVISRMTDMDGVDKLIYLSENKQHEHVIQYYHRERQDPYCFIYLELCSGSLHDFVENRSFDRGGLSPKEALKQIALGLQYIHENGIYHLDLKPSNILITCGSPKRIVLADFEVSKKVCDGKTSITTRTFGGTLGYIAPEIEYHYDFQKRLTRKADLFSYGIIVYYVWTGGYHPFLQTAKVAPKMLDEAQWRIKGYGTVPSEKLELNMISESVQENQDDVLLKDVLYQLLDKKPEMRPDARDVVTHPFFWSPHKQYQFYKQVGDCIENLRSMNQTFDSSRRLRARIDQDTENVIMGNWYSRLHPGIQQHFKKYVTQQLKNKAGHGTVIGAEFTSELVKVIRNFFVHYSNDKQKYVEVGSLPSFDDSEDNVYTSLNSLTGPFPKLLLHTYLAAVPWRDDVKLNEFYPRCDFPRFRELQEDQKQSTFENSGLKLKIAVERRLYGPFAELYGVCVTKKGELLVADKGKNCIICMGKNGENIGTVVKSPVVERPKHVACRGDEEIVVSEPRENQVKIFNRTTGEIRTIKKANGREFSKPNGVAVNSKGQIFVCDSDNKRIVLVSDDTEFEISETGSGEFQNEHVLDLAFDSHDNFYVTDRIGNKIHVYSKDGNFMRCIGPDISEEQTLEECWGIAIFEQYIAVTDFYGDKVHVLTTAGEHMCFVEDDLNHPSGIVHDRNGMFYVCDTSNKRLVRLELRLESVVSSTAGTDPTRSDVRCKRKPEENAYS